jgi:hypothetical protein
MLWRLELILENNNTPQILPFQSNERLRGVKSDSIKNSNSPQSHFIFRVKFVLVPFVWNLPHHYEIPNFALFKAFQGPRDLQIGLL